MPPSGPSEAVASRLPRSIFAYVWRTDALNQILLSLLTVVVLLLSMAPLEFRWRIINHGPGEPTLGH